LSKLIELKDINKFYRLRSDKLHVLKGINLTIEQGDFVMIMGKSGSGKTTLLNLLGLLDNFDNGNFIFDGKDVTHFNENQRSQLRNKHMGFIFQQFHLIESLTIAQNVELPLVYRGKVPKRKRIDDTNKYLEMVGLLEKKNVKPTELSGGQQQRIAIARALINDPYVIFADEPTGALDSVTSTQIMEILKKLNEDNKTIIMVTHDEELASYANKVIHIKDGLVVKVE